MAVDADPPKSLLEGYQVFATLGAKPENEAANLIRQFSEAGQKRR